MARRRAAAREQWKRQNMSNNSTTVAVQRNPLISNRGAASASASPQTVFQSLQQERLGATPVNIRASIQPGSIPAYGGRSITPTAMNINDQRRDLQVFQATTVRNMRQGRGGGRIHGIRRDVL